jgi:hypothetical protein
MATDEEIANLKELLEIYEDRKRHVDKRKAYYGTGRVPSEVALESQEVDESIARINAKLRMSSVPQEIQDATGPEAGIDVLRMEVKHLREQLNTALRWMTTELLAARDESQEYRARNEQERWFWQRANFALLLLIVVMVTYKVFWP